MILRGILLNIFGLEKFITVCTISFVQIGRNLIYALNAVIPIKEEIAVMRLLTMPSFMIKTVFLSRTVETSVENEAH